MDLQPWPAAALGAARLLAITRAATAAALAMTTFMAASAQPAALRLDAAEVVASPIVGAVELDRFGSATTVVTERQIEDLNAYDLANALRRTPGVSISRFNPVGSFGGGEGGAIFIRGRGQSRPGADIQTFIDGVPVYMGVWNHPLLDILPVNTIDRIAVYKSPQPQVFGNAVAAIDLLPKRVPQGRQQLASGRAGAGSFGTLVAQADYGARAGVVDYLIGGGHMRSDGHRDDGDGRLTNALAQVGVQMDRHWSVGALALGSDNRARDPGPLGRPQLNNGEYQTRLGLLSVSLSHRHTLAQGDVKLYATDGRGYWYRQAGTAGDTLTDWSQAGLRAREVLSPWADGELMAGLDVDTVTGRVRFRPTNARPTQFDGAPRLRVVSPYAAVNHRLDLGSWSLTPSVGLRWYDHSQFDSVAAPHAGVMLEGGPWTLRYQWARGINYPGLDVIVFSQNVIPGLGQSWRKLSPERVDHSEFGIRHAVADTLSLDLAVFNDRGANRYVFVPPPPPPPVYVNRGGASVKGAEATVTWQPASDWSVFAGVTWLDSTPSSLPYTPRWSAAAGLTGAFGPWRLSVDAQVVDDQYVLSQGRSATAVNTLKVDSYALLNARLAFRLSPQAEVFLAVENVTDTDYELRPAYPMPGRSAMLGVSARL